MEKIDLMSTQDSRKLKLFAYRIIFQSAREFCCSVSIDGNHLLRIRREDQQKLMACLVSQQSLDQALHIPANTRILDSAEINGNSHGLRKLFGRATGGDGNRLLRARLELGAHR